MDDLKINYNHGPANFTLMDGYVPFQDVETFNLSTATQEKEIVQATINAVQGRKRAAAMADHFEIEFERGEEK